MTDETISMSKHLNMGSSLKNKKPCIIYSAGSAGHMLSTKGNKRKNKQTCKIQTRIQHLIAQKKQLRGCESIRGGYYYFEGNNSDYMNPLVKYNLG